MKKPILATFLFITLFQLQAQDLTESSFGKGLINVVAADSSYSLKFAARFQSLFTTGWEDNGEFKNNGSQFLIRRARLKFEGFAYSPKLKYKIELGLSNRDIAGASVYTSFAPRIIYDAVVKWNFIGNFEVWAGQTKLPGNRERVISSGDLQFVDRSILNSQFNIDRETGIQLHHNFTFGNGFLIKEAFAISQGEGRNVTSGNIGGLQYTGRVELFPFGDFEKKGAYVGSDIYREENPKLAFGVSYDLNNDAVKTRSNSGTYMVTDYGFFKSDIHTIFLDAMFKYRGFSFMGEYAKRNAEQIIAKNSDGTTTGDKINVGNGINLQAGYLFDNNYEFALRYTGIDLNTTGQSTLNQYTVGVSKYIVGHKLKVQSDLSYESSSGSTLNQWLYRLQVDIHF